MWHRRLAAAAAGLTVGVVLMAGAGRPARAEEERGTWAQAGLGFGTVLANAVYMPAKLVYATLGTVTGGLTYALTGGSYETAESVWVASLGGNYVLTPDMLTGERSVEFSGTPEPRTVGRDGEPGPVVQEQTLPPIQDGYVREGY
jgi:hypothetical protein